MTRMDINVLVLFCSRLSDSRPSDSFLSNKNFCRAAHYLFTVESFPGNIVIPV